MYVPFRLIADDLSHRPLFLAVIVDSLSVETIAYEAFTDLAAAYDDLRKVHVDFMLLVRPALPPRLPCCCGC